MSDHIAFTCKARQQGTAGGNDPVDCDWPVCGCDPKANEVIAALEESGALSAALARVAELEARRALTHEAFGLLDTIVESWEESGKPTVTQDWFGSARELCRRFEETK